jgi:hypothetical protein
LIVGVDVFVLAMVWAAVSGSRGLSRGGTLNNRIVNALYAVATGLTLIGCSSLVYCAARSAFDHESEAGEVSVHRLDQLGAALSRECFGAVRCAQCP